MPRNVQHVAGIEIGERTQPANRVAEQFDQAAAAAAEDNRPEGGILQAANEHLDAFASHWLNEDALQAVAEPSGEIVIRDAHVVVAAQIEVHRAGVPEERVDDRVARRYARAASEVPK